MSGVSTAVGERERRIVVRMACWGGMSHGEGSWGKREAGEKLSRGGNWWFWFGIVGELVRWFLGGCCGWFGRRVGLRV